MSDIACSQCGGPTEVKRISTKWGPKDVGECTSGCKNEKGYRLGTFAKRGSRTATSSSTPSQVPSPAAPPVDREEYRDKALEAVSKNIESAQHLIVKHELGAKADVLLLADLIGKCMTAMTLDAKRGR